MVEQNPEMVGMIIPKDVGIDPNEITKMITMVEEKGGRVVEDHSDHLLLEIPKHIMDEGKLKKVV